MGIKSKLISALFSALVMGVYWLIWGSLSAGITFVAMGFTFVMVVMLFTAIGNLVYGIPVSFLSDWISNKVPSFRFIIAAFIHVSLGAATVIVFEGGYTYFAILASLFFFIGEELQHWKLRTFQVKTVTMNTMIILAVVGCVVAYNSYTTANSVQSGEEEVSNRTYLIPDGYEGPILVMYKLEGEPGLKDESGKKVIEISKEEVVYTYVGDKLQYGEGKTSSKMLHGLVKDTYFYTGDEGERTVINDECIYRGDSGSNDFYGDEEVEYEIIQVTNSNCGRNFMKNGSVHYDEQIDQVTNELSNRED